MSYRGGGSLGYLSSAIGHMLLLFVLCCIGLVATIAADPFPWIMGLMAIVGAWLILVALPGLWFFVIGAWITYMLYDITHSLIVVMLCAGVTLVLFIRWRFKEPI